MPPLFISYKLAKQKHYNNTQTYCYINSVNISNQTYYYQTSKCVYKQNFSTVHHLPCCWHTLFHHTARIHIQILRKLYEYNAGSFQEPSKHKQRKVNRSYTSASAVSHIHEWYHACVTFRDVFSDFSFPSRFLSLIKANKNCIVPAPAPPTSSRVQVLCSVHVIHTRFVFTAVFEDLSVSQDSLRTFLSSLK